MFLVGETIIYRNHGVCKIVASKNMGNGHKVIPYFMLKPIFDSTSTFYVPIGNKKVESKMHHILSDEEVKALIEGIPNADTIWIEDKNERKEEYAKILDEYNRSNLIKLMKTLYLQQQHLKDEGKKLYASDMQFMLDAEKILYDEFAFVLNIKREEAQSYLFKQFEKSIEKSAKESNKS